MPASDLATFVNLMGFMTGIALYGMLGLMTIRGRRHADGSDSGLEWIPLATALLGLTWNAVALVIYAFRDFQLSEPPALAVAVAFSALGFLPAVVVHGAVAPLPNRRILAWTAYFLSGTAALMHLQSAIVSGMSPSRPALLTLTIGYAAVVALLAVLVRGQPTRDRGVSIAALAAFAVMALHLTQHGATEDTWWVELLGHHASLPLALAILYQDYRFALADHFLKRFLLLIAMASIAVACYLLIAVPLALPRLANDPAEPIGLAILIALWTGTAMALPFVRRRVDHLVDRRLLKRADYRRVRSQLEHSLSLLDTPAAMLDATVALLAPAVSARQATWESSEQPTSLRARVAALDDPHGSVSASVYVPTALPPAYVIRLGSLSGGRRLLSDDIAMLEGVAEILGRRIDAVRLTQDRFEQALRSKEMLQLATEAELRALRAQLNPHFLFNALTTIGYLTQTAPGRAVETLYRLTGLLRAVLRRSDREFTSLGEELEIVESYLSIERARFEERLVERIEVDEALRAVRVPPLVIQPLVENAVKHGITKQRDGGTVSIIVRLEREDGAPRLRISVTDTGAGASPDELAAGRAGGVGLSNLERRLERYYGSRAALSMRSRPGEGTTVELVFPAEGLDEHRVEAQAPFGVPSRTARRPVHASGE